MYIGQLVGWLDFFVLDLFVDHVVLVGYVLFNLFWKAYPAVQGNNIHAM